MAERVEHKGMLILIAGPSASGKDTLISAARQAFANRPDFVFPTRLITRSDQCGEEHIYLSPQDFDQLRSKELFFLEWDAHGLSYGVPASIWDDLAAGRAVVFNISRRMIPEARRRWAHTHVIALSVEPALLRERLRARGRETEAEIEARVVRAGDGICRIDPPFHVLDNSGPIEESASRFVALLSNLKAGTPAEGMAANHFEDPSALRLA